MTKKKREKWGKSGSADVTKYDLHAIIHVAKKERRSKSAQIAVELDAAFAHLDAGGTWAGSEKLSGEKFNNRIEFTLPDHTFKRLGVEATAQLRTNAAQAAMTIYQLHRHLAGGGQLTVPKPKRSTPRRKRADRDTDKAAA